MAPARAALHTEIVGSKRRIRRTGEPSFPYAKSILISWGLLVTTMLITAALSDPKSGEIEHPAIAWPMLAGLPVVILAVFFIEFKQKNRGKRTSSDDEF
jgi:hypothetical protein